jgi:hypothetical protein
MSDDKVNILTLKWGVRYGPEYVNRLYGAVARHLKRPHRFVCFTDNAAGLDPGVVSHPIPELDMPETTRVTPWRKLGLFREDLPVSGTSLFLDLDLLIVDSIDCFFDFEPEKIPIIHNWTNGMRRLLGQRPPVGNSSVFRFEARKCGFVVEQFNREKDWALANFRPPQTYLTHCIRPNMVWWPEEWVRSFKRHCLPTFPFNLILTPRIPAGCRMIAFHGKPDPDEVIGGYRGRRPHHHARPTPWVAEHWK